MFMWGYCRVADAAFLIVNLPLYPSIPRVRFVVFLWRVCQRNTTKMVPRHSGVVMTCGYLDSIALFRVAFDVRELAIFIRVFAAKAQWHNMVNARRAPSPPLYG